MWTFIRTSRYIAGLVAISIGLVLFVFGARIMCDEDSIDVLDLLCGDCGDTRVDGWLP